MGVRVSQEGLVLLFCTFRPERNAAELQVRLRVSDFRQPKREILDAEERCLQRFLPLSSVLSEVNLIFFECGSAAPGLRGSICPLVFAPPR